VIVDRDTSRMPPALTRHPFVVVMVAAGLLARIAWAVRYGKVLDGEGVEYARIAENLVAGRGYVGIFNNGAQLNFPPLYPMLIAAAGFVSPSTDIAVRVVCITFGAALVIPLYHIARRMYGPAPARLVAAFAALHPVLVATGASSFAEGPYLTLFASAILALMIWVDARRRFAAIATGILFGLAYLVRPEAFLFAGVATCGALIAAAASKGARALAVGALFLAMAFALVATPNVVFLTRQTGQLRLEAKGTLAYAWGQRMNAGMSYVEAVKGVGDDLSEQGVFMRPNRDVITSTSYTPGQYLTFAGKALRRNIPVIAQAVGYELVFGAPFFFALVVLGLFSRPWGPRRLMFDGILIGTLALLIAVLLSVQDVALRYLLTLLGLMVVWAGNGASALGAWAGATAVRNGLGPRGARHVAGVMVWSSVLLTFAASLVRLSRESQFSESMRPERRLAGSWIASHASGRPRVMEFGDQVTFYSGGDLMYLPYTSSATAVRYLARKTPDFIVLEQAEKDKLPYYAQWLERGIPDSRAALVYDEDATGSNRIRIYRWDDGTPAAP